MINDVMFSFILTREFFLILITHNFGCASRSCKSGEIMKELSGKYRSVIALIFHKRLQKGKLLNLFSAILYSQLWAKLSSLHDQGVVA